MNRIALSMMLSAAIAVAALSVPRLSEAAQEGSRVTFEVTDEPGRWFKNTAGPIAGTQSLAVLEPGGEVVFTGQSRTVHTRTSLIFPTGAAGMPFDTKPMKGGASVVLETPGLYVFTCKIHPYMFAAVIVDDPATPELDLGRSITLVNGITVPTASDLALRLVRTFFIATTPSNWQVHSASGTSTWDPSYPPVPVLAFDAGGNPVSVPNLDTFFQGYFGEPVTLAKAVQPSTRGVGEVWVDTQFELTAGKDKPGTATAVDADTWQIRRKVSLPQINMNNPHNMWTDRDQTLIYQTQWFDSRLTVFDRLTGALVKNITVGEAPAHVMTRADTDQLHVTLNGASRTESVVELAPLAASVERRIDIGRPHPHAHWMGHDGKTMVTPNAFTADSTKYDFVTDSIDAIVPTGAIPIATGMMPDSSKYYVANLLDSTITVVDMGTRSVINTINLLANYDPISGAITGPVGALPIQTPVSPDGKYMVTANTLTGTITIVRTSTDTLVKMLPCDPGCHGVQFGAKRGGGYYAYVSSKFSNSLIVVDGDPNGDGNPGDAAIAGRVILVATPSTAMDDQVIGQAGMGGQGVLAIPIVYNGWVQQLPPDWSRELTASQRNPLP
jgi:YVTN family beta-propeller protein